MRENKQKPLVSVMIPVYNVENYLRECLDSVIAQEYGNLEIILVDDGSQDGCPQICDEYGRKDSRIRVIHQENGGLSAARNVALQYARGEYLAFVDSDDSVSAQLIGRAVELLEERNLSAVVFEANLIDENSLLIGERFQVYDEYTEISAHEAFERIVSDELGSQVWKGVYERTCWDQIRFPLGMYYEDIFVTYQAYARMTKPVGFLPEKLYNYRLNANGISLLPKNQEVKAYHRFLGFRQAYLFAKERCRKETVARCLANATLTARGVIVDPRSKCEAHIESKLFLHNEMRRIVCCPRLSNAEKVKAFLDTYCPFFAQLLRQIINRRE